MPLTPEQEALRTQFTDTGSTWTPAWERVLQIDPSYFAAYLKLHHAAFNKRLLPPKLQHLLILSADASCCTEYGPGIRANMAAALAAGATQAEVLETLELTSVLGVHSVSCGVPLLHEVLAEEGKPAIFLGESQIWDKRQSDLRDRFTATRGYWDRHWNEVLCLDPDFLEGYLAFSGEPFDERKSIFDRKTKELVYIAIDSATTHMFLPGLKLHIRNAVKFGATPYEIMEVFELVNLMGIHTMLEGVTALKEISN
ncbi:carboxymuconolactone decarboxylase [Talaromyces proteolyticus]|uniref:Carboxymuconolactone decarboxylase n=1 Tax=Talaromyces proteolyticus TaxID=1131652 RepID=A0AAD4Q220_9EURO|nr:carboxymuconolactone decarboxylase [Talaromyces proteolyticus]KAH8699105.1 carboxymuconolactone decarboxylase [Talaromyces proteolyticus]